MRPFVFTLGLVVASAASAQPSSPYELPFAVEGNVIEVTLDRADAAPSLDGVHLRVAAAPPWVLVDTDAPKNRASETGSVTAAVRFDVSRDAPIGEPGTITVEVVDANGTALATRTYAVEVAAPTDIAVELPRPNPVRDRARVPFALPQAAEVRVDVFDLLGRRVQVLADGPHEAGGHEATLDARSLASGVYVVRVTAEMAGHVEVGAHRITVVR